MLMRFTYDPTVDACYMKLRRKSKAGRLVTQAAGSGIYVDFDVNGKVIGVEFLDASYHFPKSALVAMAKQTTDRKRRRA
jgi:uncharacterized protein YuzE